MSLKSSLTANIVSSEKWQRLIFAVISTLIILLAANIPIQKFYLELQEGQVMHRVEQSTYLTDDLDSDGNSERVYIFNSAEAERLTIMLYDSEGLIKQTINFINHQWRPNSFPAIYDIDEDGTKEVLIISIRNDSVLLNAVNLFTQEFCIKDLLIGEVEKPVQQMAFGTRFIDFQDFNGDSIKELYFQFDAGYGLKPRGLYRYDYGTRQLFATPESYIPWTPPEFADLNRDGIPELLARSYAPCNVTFETEFTDGRAWIGAFDLELNYLFSPKPMPKGYGYAYPSPATFSDTLFFYIFSSRESDTIPNRIFLIDYHGNIINEKAVYQDDPTLYSQQLKIINRKNYLLINNIGQFELTGKLEGLPEGPIKRQKNYNPYYHLISYPVDVNDDGIKELAYYNLNTSVIEILNPHLKKLSSYQLPFERLRILGIYPYLTGGKTDKLMVITDSGYFFMRFLKNPLYWIKYLIWLTIFALSWMFIYAIQFLQRRRMEQNWETEKKLTELQFNTIRNQLNPHFVFNALSAVGYLIEKGQKEEAYDFLSINTRLIRKVLDDADITTRTLMDEINFVKDYLTVQEFRFKDRFKTIFEIDPKVNKQLAVPKMVLHTYVENAIKHGFQNIQSGGILNIQIKSIPNGIVLIIGDNGITDATATNTNNSTGKGIKIMESYYRLYEKQHQCKIHTSISNRKSRNGRKQEGTRVEIKIEYL